MQESDLGGVRGSAASSFRALHGLKAHPTFFSFPGYGAAQPADSLLTFSLPLLSQTFGSTSISAYTRLPLRSS